MIEWMRQHNQTASAEKKIRFYGMDVIDPNLPDSVQMYFDKFVPELSMKAKQILTGFNTMSNDSFIMMESQYKWIGDYLSKNKTSLVKKSGEELFSHAFIESQMMIEQVGMAKAGEQSPHVRDSAMALNAQMILSFQKPGSRIISLGTQWTRGCRRRRSACKANRLLPATTPWRKILPHRIFL